MIPIVTLLAVSACDNRGPSVETLRAAGELRVALVSVPHTYYLEPEGILGFDYELLRAFCASIGVRLAVTMVATREQAKTMVARRKVHVAAGLIPVTADADPEIRFGPSYSMLQAQVIQLSGRPRPEAAADLIGATIETLPDSLGEAELRRLARTHGGLHWRARPLMSNEKLLARVAAGQIEYAVVPSTDFMVLRLRFPRLEVAFDLGEPHAAAWVLSQHLQRTVDDAVLDFFVDSEKRGLREGLWDRYYGHYGPFDFVDADAFLSAYHERFPELRQLFLDAGADVGIDWRLLAALSYQESRWDPEARSPTGVRGLMMLTRQTARRLRVSRLDPGEAVDGGARYLADLLERVPGSVVEDDRLWFALAAYNTGLGHVEDARVVTERQGGNPHVWRDVRRCLPLLAKKTVARTLRYGKARGGETVDFVDATRRYFDVMRQLERRGVAAGDDDRTPGTRILGVL